MQALDPVETILARLMPPAMSEDCQLEIEALIDDLAGLEDKPRFSWFTRWLVGGGIAAAIAGAFTVFPIIHDAPDTAVAVIAPSPPNGGFVLLSESDRIESMTDEGWQEDPDGSAVRTLRLSAVEENSVRDEESGMVVQISEPREEIFLMPISTF